MKNIGILAIQGAFIEHKNVLDSFNNVNTILIKMKKDIENLDGLIIPGGESSVMRKFIKDWDLYDSLYKYIFIDKLPVFGTCAGCILLSKIVITNDIEEEGLFPILDIKVKRNGYGKQISSFIENIKIENIGSLDTIYIRAPIIVSYNKKYNIISKYNDMPTLLKHNNILVCTYHPELSTDLIHKYFLDML